MAATNVPGGALYPVGSVIQLLATEATVKRDVGFGGNCFACHAPARQPLDFVCDDSHGCEIIPFGR